MSPPDPRRRTYDAWRELLSAELGVDVLDDEGRRRCARDGLLGAILSRDQAERYFAWNAFVRRRRSAAAGP